MLDLDNLDLELDEDFPTSSLENNLFESSFNNSLSWTEIRNDRNSIPNKSKIVRNERTKNLQKKDETKNMILELLESSEENPKNNSVSEVDDISKRDSSNIFDFSFIPKEIEDTEKNDIIQTKNSGKRVLTHRKFPGPAGLLPDKPLQEISDINVILDNSVENLPEQRKKEAVILCSQTSSVFREESFKKLAFDFDLYNDNCPLNKYTVDWVKKRALKKTLCGKKIPFIAVVLHNLDHGTPDPVITLRDQTGEIYGTLHREVWSQLGGKLHPGAALALRQVGVLITGIARRQVHLNVTSNNIINIYSYTNEEIVETNCINELDKNDLIKSVLEWQKSVSSVELKQSSNLFSTVGGMGGIKSPHVTTFMNTKSSFKNPATNNGDDLKTSIQHNNRTSMGDNPVRENVESKNCINFMTSMEDDISDFMASLGESEFDGKLFDETKGSNESSNLERENIRKRKMDAEAVLLNNDDCPTFGKKFIDCNSYVPQVRKMECQEKFILASQSLSQAESQIVEEVLDGIDIDDFDN